MTDPLDLLLCPGCGASVEPTMHPAETVAGLPWPGGWSASCSCGYVIAAEVVEGDPPTLRRILAGADVGEFHRVDLGAYTRAVARALGVL